MTDLAAIVARDALPTDHVRADDVRAAYRDRSALLALLRETRDAVYAFARSYELIEPDHPDHAAGCTFCSLHAVLTRLAALDTEAPA